MAFRTILGKLFLTDQDRQIIDADLRVVERYTEEVLEQERRLEEERRAAEAREAARKAEEERLAAIRKAEEAKLAEAEQEKEQNSSEERFCPMVSSDYDGPRYSLAGPYYEEDVEKPKTKKADKKYSLLDEPGRYSLDIRESEPADLFGYNSPFGIDDILSDPVVSRTMHRDMTFAEKLAQLMQKYAMTSSEVYKAGNVDKSLFSRILSNPYYMPSKDTAISVALALKLSPEEAEDLLKRAGYTLSHSIPRDIVLECCFKKKIFNVIEVNIILDKLGHKPLSRIPT